MLGSFMKLSRTPSYTSFLGVSKHGSRFLGFSPSSKSSWFSDHWRRHISFWNSCTVNVSMLNPGLKYRICRSNHHQERSPSDHHISPFSSVGPDPSLIALFPSYVTHMALSFTAFVLEEFFFPFPVYFQRELLHILDVFLMGSRGRVRLASSSYCAILISSPPSFYFPRLCVFVSKVSIL